VKLETFMLFFLSALLLCACKSVEPDKNNGWQLQFADNFESEATKWDRFELICDPETYKDGIGRVCTSVDAAYEGKRSLCVWANEQKTVYSNHVSATYCFSPQRQSGRWRYEVKVYIPSITGSKGQVGPEFSMENTRQTAPGVFKTSTAGIQYLANPIMAECGTWYVWHQAQWTGFLVFKLETDTWYTLAVEADFVTNEYISFEISRDNVTDSCDLKAYSMSQEMKPEFFSEGFWLTCETENIWGQPNTDYILYYDSVVLEEWY
jgi:hypothetical protein